MKLIFFSERLRHLKIQGKNSINIYMYISPQIQNYENKVFIDSVSFCFCVECTGKSKVHSAGRADNEK